MEIREIETFLKAADLKSFSAAARALGYSQAAVTIQIKNLEDEFGVRLFDRIGRQVRLTHRGDIFYSHAIRIRKELTSAREAVADAGELHGRLAIGAIVSISSCVIPEILKTFHMRYPKVSVDIYLDSPNVLLEKLDAGELDLVYLLDQKVYGPKWCKYLEEPEEIIFVTAASRPFPADPSPALDELLTEPFLLTEREASYRSTLDNYLHASGKSLEPFLSTGDTGFLVDFVKTGAGITFLPRFVVKKELEAGTLAEIPVRDFHLRLWRQLLYHKDKWFTREMQAFCSLAAGDST